MTDRELLELAAKAAGLEVSLGIDGAGWVNDGSKIWPKWRPLLNGGDALHLAVRLCMEIDICDQSVSVTAFGLDEPVWISFDGDPVDMNPVVRRAIVIAAAQLGKDMP